MYLHQYNLHQYSVFLSHVDFYHSKFPIKLLLLGAARHRNVLQELQPVITIVEEAAEVFEAHTVTSLTSGCQHLILIGDHQQLRPNPTVYDLQKNYAFDVSLFERMVTNGLQFERLCLQHRMRPQIAKMLDHIYVNPRLQNHHKVLEFENVKGVERNLFFVDHKKKEVITFLTQQCIHLHCRISSRL